MNRVAMFTSLLAVFLTGIALGFLGGTVLHGRRGHELRHELFGWPGNGPEPKLGEALPRLTQLLDLTPSQVARLEPKVLETRRQFAALRDSLGSRIESELTPQQVERWRALRRDRRFPGGPRGRAYRALPGDEGGSR